MTTACAICKINVTKVKAPGLQCMGKCKLFFHYEKCAKLTSDECDQIEKKKMIWFCENCSKKRHSLIFPRRESSSKVDDAIIKESEIFNTTSDDIIEIRASQRDLQNKVDELITLVKEKMNEKTVEFSKVLATVDELAEKMKSIEKKINRVEPYKEFKETTAQSFVEVLKMKRVPKFIVKPKNTEQTSDQTRTDLRTSVDILNVKGARSCQSGGIVLTCNNSENSEEFQKNILAKMGDKYDVNIMEPKKPTLKIIGLFSKLSSEYLEERIRAQNDVILKNSFIKVLEVKESPRGIVATMEADFSTYENIVQVGKLNIEFERCRVFPHVNVTRCFNCQEFGHISRYCKNPTLCGKCSSEHKTNDCQSEGNKCVNCIFAKEKLHIESDLDVNHCAWSVRCPVFLRKQEVTLKRLRFRE